MGRLVVDITGQKFFRLTVVSYYGNHTGQTSWVCRCDCGNVTIVRGTNLKSGAVKSCGCYRGPRKNNVNGLSQSRAYKSWQHMLIRCENESAPNYYKYGARGIKVCDEWHDFLRFYADMGERPKGMSLDRIDNNGDYCKENCRWSTVSEQNNNTRRTRVLTLMGESHSITEWSRIVSINSHTITSRIKKGWSVCDALTTPVKKEKGDGQTAKAAPKKAEPRPLKPKVKNEPKDHSGENHPRSLFTNKEVIYIRELKSNGISRHEIYKMYPAIKHKTINNIYYGETWKNITTEPKREAGLSKQAR